MIAAEKALSSVATGAPILNQMDFGRKICIA